MNLYVDTSAWVKLYIHETGSVETGQVWDEASLIGA
jgi:predicted nucleic acid-binding protein